MIEIIAAVDEKYGIGLRGQMAWHYPEDMKFFKKMTQGETIVMGNTTWESLGRPLKERRHIVLSRKKRGMTITPEEVHFQSINGFFSNEYSFFKKYYLIGGGQIYHKFLEMDVVKYITLTRIPGDHECDVFFPSVFMKNFGMFDGKDLGDGLKVERYVRKVY